MDVAKYIGLYLLKNQFCYIHGLGNLELKRRPAAYDGQSLSAPQYDVVLTRGGSIDDNLANYMATHEQTSISKAANSLRDFSMSARADLSAGKDVEIPSIGRFTEQSGIISFVTNPALEYTPPSVPALKTARHAEEAPSFKRNEHGESDSYSSSGNIDWGKVGLWAGVIVVIILLAVLVVHYMNGRQETTQKPATVKDTAVMTPPVAVAPTPADTMHKDSGSAPVTAPPAPTGPVNSPIQYQVILNSYTTRAAAEKRAKMLTGNGNKVEIVSKDSTTFAVVIPITSAPADTVKMLDSLRRFFNPKGVHIYH